MRGLHTLGIGLVLLVLSTGTALARNGAWYVGGDFGGMIAEDVVFNGPYAGFDAGGFSAGVMTFDGKIGTNWSGAFGNNTILFGAEGSLGIQVPTNTFELWGNLRAGTPIAHNLVLFGTGGLGIIGGTPVYDGGLGILLPVSPSLALDVQALTRGVVGSAPKEFGFKAGLDWYLTDDERGPGVQTAGGWVPSNVDVLVGPSLGSVSTGGVIPGVSGQIWLPLQNGIDFGVRGNVGIQLPTNRPELWGGMQVGTTIVDGKYIYGFVDVGVVGNTPANAIGGGAMFDLPNTGVKLGGEVFGRGALGTITEGGARAGLFFDFDREAVPAAAGRIQRNFTP